MSSSGFNLSGGLIEPRRYVAANAQEWPARGLVHEPRRLPMTKASNGLPGGFTLRSAVRSKNPSET